MGESPNFPAIVSGVVLLMLLILAFRHHGAVRVVSLVLAGPLFTYTMGLVRNVDAPTTAVQMRWALVDIGGDPLTVAIPLVVIVGAIIVWLVRIPDRRRKRRQAAMMIRDGAIRADNV